MKKIFLYLLLCLAYTSYGQQKTKVGFDGGYNQLLGGSFTDSVFAIPIRDTIGWNYETLRKFARITMRPQDHKIYYHDSTRWVSIGGDVDISGKVDKTTTVNGHALSSDVTVSASDVGLSNVNNTSDASKPISNAQQTALDLKANIADLPCLRTDSLVRVGCGNVIQGTVAYRVGTVVVGGLDTTANDSNETITGFRAKAGSGFADNLPYGGRATLYGFGTKGAGAVMGYRCWATSSESSVIGTKSGVTGNASWCMGCDGSHVWAPSGNLCNLLAGCDVTESYGALQSCIQCGAVSLLKRNSYVTIIGGLADLYPPNDSTVNYMTTKSHLLGFGMWARDMSLNHPDFQANGGWFNTIQFGAERSFFRPDSIDIRFTNASSRSDTTGAGFDYTRNQSGQLVTFHLPGGSGNAISRGYRWTVYDTLSYGLAPQVTEHSALSLDGYGVLTTYFLDNYNSEPASYTSLSKISKGYAEGRYGTLSQQNTNTSAIATNTSAIAANTSAIAGKQSAITTGTTAQYFDGTLGLKTFLTDVKAIGDTAYLRKNALVDTVHNLPYFINTPSGAGNFVRQVFFGFSPTQGLCINRYSTTGMAIGPDSGTTNQSATNYAIYMAKDKSNTRLSSLGTVNLDIAGAAKLTVQPSGRITIATTSDDGSTTLQVNGSISIASIGGSGMLKSDATNHPTLATAGTDYPTILNATLSSGTVTISDAAITGSAKICGAMYTTQSGTIGTSFSYTYTAGVGYTITSSSILDNSVISYMLKR